MLKPLLRRWVEGYLFKVIYLGSFQRMYSPLWWGNWNTTICPGRIILGLICTYIWKRSSSTTAIFLRVGLFCFLISPSYRLWMWVTIPSIYAEVRELKHRFLSRIVLHWRPLPLETLSTSTHPSICQVRLCRSLVSADCNQFQSIALNSNKLGSFSYVKQLCLKSCPFWHLWYIDLPSLERISIGPNSFYQTVSSVFESYCCSDW